MMYVRMSLRCFVVAVVVCAISCTYPERTEGGGNGTGSGLNSAKVVSIQFLKSYYKGYPYTFSENYKIKGCVISTDRYRNIIKTLIVQDESGVLEIKVDRDDLFRTFPKGTFVELSCNALTLGVTGGTLQIGAAASDDFETGYIADDKFDNIITVTGRYDQELLAEEYSITGLSDDCLGHFIAIRDVMFENYALNWCDDDPANIEKLVDTDRRIVDRDGNFLLVRTARYAEFAVWELPHGSGTIEGILSKYGGGYRLKVLEPGTLYYTMSKPRFDEEE